MDIKAHLLNPQPPTVHQDLSFLRPPQEEEHTTLPDPSPPPPQPHPQPGKRPRDVSTPPSPQPAKPPPDLTDPPSPQPDHPAIPACKPARSSAPQVIEISSSSDDANNDPVTPPRKRPRVSSPHSSDTPHDGDSDDVVIVSHKRAGALVSADTNADVELVATNRDDGKANGGCGNMQVVDNGGNVDSDGVVVVGSRRGVRALSDFPHFKFQCEIERFSTRSWKEAKRYCPRCFCFVCDDFASKCRYWSSHARAVDSSRKWRRKRAIVLEKRQKG